jgi:RNA polymerase sigma-70 factor (ECF subfamily)
MTIERKFAKMYDTYADDIFRYLLVHVHDKHTAEDLTADTFMKGWKAIDKFDFAQPRPWLYTIARNVLNDHWRKKQPILVDEPEEQVSDVNVEEIVEKVLVRERVVNAVSSLPEMMRSVVTLRFLLQYSARKTADSLGMTEVNVRVLQHRALKKLKGELQ